MAVERDGSQLFLLFNIVLAHIYGHCSLLKEHGVPFSQTLNSFWSFIIICLVISGKISSNHNFHVTNHT